MLVVISIIFYISIGPTRTEPYSIKESVMEIKSVINNRGEVVKLYWLDLL